MLDHDLLADLPAPRDDEPPSLRADISDELADHLRCALRREVFKDGDERAAQQRVLERFGDPKKIARRLWWQAMWSLVMRQRILSGVQWLVSVTAVVLAGAVFWQQSQMWQEMRAARQEEAVQRQAVTTALNQLQAQNRAAGLPAPVAVEGPVRTADEYSGLSMDPGTDAVTLGPPLPVVASDDAGVPAPTADESPPVLTVQFVLGTADGPSLTPRSVELVGNDGVILPGDFRSLRPGRYELEVTLADGQNSTRPVLVRDEKPQQLTVICPKSRPTATVLVTMPPLPEELQEAVSQWDFAIDQQPVLLDGVAWRPPLHNPQTMSFDPKTGKAITLSEFGKCTDLSNVKPEDSVVFVPEGPVSTGFSLSLKEPKRDTEDFYVDTVRFPPEGSPPDDPTLLPRTVEPGENRWVIELPEEFLAQARRSLGVLKGGNDLAGEPSVSPSPLMPAAPVSRAEDLPPESTTPPQLTVKLGQGKEGGPPANINDVTIMSRKTRLSADEQGSRDNRRFVFETLPPDHYHLTVQLSDGQECTRPVLIRDEKPQELTIICPGPRKEVPVLITVPPLPEELQKRKFRLKVIVAPGPVEIGQTKWTTPNSPPQEITFDRATGLPIRIKVPETDDHFDLSELPADERSVFLAVGTVHYWFSAAEVLDHSGSVPVYSWPKNMDTVGLKQTISADQKTWKLELPQEYLDEILAQENTGALPPSEISGPASFRPTEKDPAGTPNAESNRRYSPDDEP